MSTVIHQYIRNKKGDRKGVLIGIKQEQYYTVGWSLCKKGDKFDRHKGFQIAHDRAISFLTRKRMSFADSIKEDFEHFEARCRRYFMKSTVPDDGIPF